MASQPGPGRGWSVSLIREAIRVTPWHQPALAQRLHVGTVIVLLDRFQGVRISVIEVRHPTTGGAGVRQP